MTKRKVSRQREWQIRKREEGRCMICGKESFAPHGLCKKHLKVQRERNRAVTGCDPWKPGGRGRIPLEQAEKQAKRDEKNIERGIKLLEAGNTYQAAAAKLGVSFTWLHSRVKMSKSFSRRES